MKTTTGHWSQVIRKRRFYYLILTILCYWYADCGVKSIAVITLPLSHAICRECCNRPIIKPHMHPLATDRVAWSVGRSVDVYLSQSW